MSKQWYSVRCLFKHNKLKRKLGNNKLYEERITIWKASSFENAIEMAEAEAKEYADLESKYLGFSQAFQLFEEDLKSGSEIFSLMRESRYKSRKYIKKYFYTGNEREGHV